MMRELIKNWMLIFLVLLTGTTVQAELQLVCDFEGLTGHPDGQACNGVLGGFLDTESDGTGNAALGNIDGSNAMNVIGHSSGNLARAVGFGGIDNPIDNSETGIGFFRFMLRDSGLVPRSHMGLIADATENPINAENTGDPTVIPAGFRLVANGTGFDMVTTDDTATLKIGLERGQWYNVWIVADNTADTFDLFVSEAAGPAGEATLPNSSDLVKSDIPFGAATDEPLTGMIFANPTGTGQAERIYVDDIWWDGDRGLASPTKAGDPNPADANPDVPRDVVLSWTPGPFANIHDVYFGTSFDDVSVADPINPLGVLVSPGQSINTYNPGLLEYGTTYYWRVDEVNAPPDSTIFKGDIWSFTVEPYAYPISGDMMTATASSQVAADQGPENTINGSGLDENDLHSDNLSDMWLSAPSEPNMAWIKYEFDNVHMLHEMWVWNYNAPSLLAALGLKDVTIEYSIDDVTWDQLGDDIQFPPAIGMSGYESDIRIAFNDTMIKYVRITANSNQADGGFFNQYGLSEVRFYSVPNSARYPNPDNNASNVDLDVTLGWRAGRGATEHEVYIGTDEQTVRDEVVPFATTGQNTYGPLTLDLGTMYYWRIDEVNEVIWAGDIWQFSTLEYILIEDFEDYNDIDPDTVYLTWIDGWDNPLNGSTIGYPNPDFIAGEHYMETTIRHGGRQSAPLLYDNSSATYSEVIANTNDLEIGRDWTKGNPQMLSLWFYGDAGNSTTDRLYVKLNNNAKVSYDGALTQAGWQQLTVNLSDFGVNLGNVTHLGIGIERIDATGGSGILFIDDIQLFTPLND